jgi:hypothetical protein
MGEARAGYARARELLRVSRWLAVLLIPLTITTLVGYVWIYVQEGGKFCGVTFSASQEKWIVAWAGIGVLTLATFFGIAWLRTVVRWKSARDR